MTSNALTFEDIETGAQIAHREFEISRDTLVRYAGASGDFNPIHYNDEVATEVGLPGVIAHGMLTMGTAISAVLGVLGPEGTVQAYSTRFTKPVPVPATGRTVLDVTATVRNTDPEARTVELDITAEAGGNKVLGRARATVAFTAPEQSAPEAAEPSAPGTAREDRAEGSA